MPMIRMYINADYGYSLLNLNTNSFEYSLFSKNLKYYNIDSDANFYMLQHRDVYRFQKTQQNSTRLFKLGNYWIEFWITSSRI